MVLTRLQIPVEVAVFVHVSQRIQDLVCPVPHFGLLEQLVLVFDHLIQVTLLHSNAHLCKAGETTTSQTYARTR